MKLRIAKEEEEEKKKRMVAETERRAAREGGGGGEGRTMVVGVKMDPQSRELLTWSLVKVAGVGDRVIALHVLPPSSNECSEADGKVSSLISLVKTFDSILAVYEGFCNLKQIDLKLKICRGSSIRKVLVQETKFYSARKLILGVAKHNSIIGFSSTSIAKYCAKKLPGGCSVLAVNNGKVVFQREALPEFGEQESIRNSNGSESLILAGVSENERCSLCRSSNVLERKDDSMALIPTNKLDSNKPLLQNSPVVRPRWSLLRRAIKNERKASMKRSKVSMLRQVLRLPSWYPTPLAVHSDQKLMKPELECLKQKYSSVCRLFSYTELMQATSNFSSDNLVGKGGSSWVYKGCLSDSKEIAAKFLKPSKNAVKEFASEIETITALHHKNIISLLGFCFEDDNLILVYDFISMGSLEECLHGKQENSVHLKCIDRYKIASGIAEALAYLHGDGQDQAVIHGDVKSSNILLSADFEPQLCDFGLAKWKSASATPTPVDNVAGTFGYLAPEYFMYGKVTEKIDVYAFGVVLLELISGRKPISTESSNGQESLVLWAKKIIQEGKFEQLVDQSLGDQYDDDQMDRMILAASLCIKQAPRSRPPVSTALKLLQGDDDILRWARSEVGASEELHDSDDEAESPASNIQSYINLALLDADNDSLSASSNEPPVDSIVANTSLEVYLEGRLSCWSSFN